MNIRILVVSLILFSGILSSCESEAEKRSRLAKIEQVRLEAERKVASELRNIEVRRAEADRERMIKEEQERKRKVIYDKWINNSLSTGATPYAYCFGRNETYNGNYCSQIKVKTPYSSDVLVTIKKNKKVYRHAYIKSGSSYTFEFPNGEYQAFFYYGKGWNPNKFMKKTDCGNINGGFITQEHFGKDKPQELRSTILTYELILQQNGNFSTKASSKDEAF
jgi:hypothetical protein